MSKPSPLVSCTSKPPANNGWRFSHAGKPAISPELLFKHLYSQAALSAYEYRFLNKKPFDRDDDSPSGGETTTRMQSTTDPDSGQQTRKGKANDQMAWVGKMNNIQALATEIVNTEIILA